MNKFTKQDIGQTNIDNLCFHDMNFYDKNFRDGLVVKIYLRNMIVTLLGYQKSTLERHQFDNRYGI